MRAINPDIAELGARYGVHLPGVRDFSTPAMAADHRIAMDHLGMAMDAPQQPLLTMPNAAIPVWFTTLMDPEVIRIAVAPMRGTEILGSEQKKGDWITSYIQFPVVEQIGEAVAYGDWNNNGTANVNVNWSPRQAFTYQTITRWGEREVALAGAAGLNYKNELDMSSISVLNRFQNRTYFYGVSGILNFGILNAPGLPAPITPSTKAAGGTAWTNATANEVFDDVKKLVVQLVTQTKGLIEPNDAMTLALSPGRAALLANTNSFGLSAMALIKMNYPNMRVVTAPEYSTDAGELVQLWASRLDGQDVGYTAFTEKLRSHAIVVELSAWLQKKSQGTFGAIVKQPLGAAQMIGI